MMFAQFTLCLGLYFCLPSAIHLLFFPFLFQHKKQTKQTACSTSSCFKIIPNHRLLRPSPLHSFLAALIFCTSKCSECHPSEQWSALVLLSSQTTWTSLFLAIMLPSVLSNLLWKPFSFQKNFCCCEKCLCYVCICASVHLCGTWSLLFL